MAEERAGIFPPSRGRISSIDTRRPGRMAEWSSTGILLPVEVSHDDDNDAGWSYGNVQFVVTRRASDRIE